jgi:hypothetical protein
MFDHPVTLQRAVNASVKQQKQFNSAVLRAIGSDADEATQPVMSEAYGRIGAIFNGIGSKGAIFDDALQTEVASVVDDALRTVPESAIKPFSRNVDDLLAAVDDAGRINGEQFIKIRSRLSQLADDPNVGQAAEKLEDALLSALERSHPEQRVALRGAVDQWRSMRIIQTAIGKGMERDISPLRLANAIATRSNQAMSVYGQGGNQRLVGLAQAGRDVLPDTLPQSGTAPRSLIQAPLRAVATAPLYRAAQSYLARQPLPPGGGVLRNRLIPATAVGVNALDTEERP